MIYGSFDDFANVLTRIAGYLKAKVGNFKVHKLFLINGEIDVEAISLLTAMLKSRFAKNDVLDIQCHITFQLSGKEREVVVCAASRISETHIRIIWHHCNKQVDSASITRNEASCSSSIASKTTVLSTPSTVSRAMSLPTPSTDINETILTPPLVTVSNTVLASSELPVTTDDMYVMKKRKGGRIVDLGSKSQQIIYKQMRNTLEDAYAIDPLDMDATLVAMLSTEARNKVKNALKDNDIDYMSDFTIK